MTNLNWPLVTLKARLPSWILEIGIYGLFARQMKEINQLDKSSFVELKHNPERLSACYKEVIDNIQELQWITGSWLA